MPLPLSHHWPIRCARCGHRAEITASVADLASKALRCGACGHRQQFEPSTVINHPVPRTAGEPVHAGHAGADQHHAHHRRRQIWRLTGWTIFGRPGECVLTL
jgi:DNA-directed RNA polymerase subunit RPC12/RpoP